MRAYRIIEGNWVIKDVEGKALPVPPEKWETDDNIVAADDKGQQFSAICAQFCPKQSSTNPADQGFNL